MKPLRTLLLIIAAIAIALPSNAKKVQKESKAEEAKIVTIYAFGVSQDLIDSTVYMTNIAPISGAEMLPHGQLKNWQYYSEQMEKYVEDTLHCEHQTTAFFYATSLKKVEKLYARVQLKMKKRAMSEITFKQISTEDFHFKVPVLQPIDN